jgi:hypothetical protein
VILFYFTTIQFDLPMALGQQGLDAIATLAPSAIAKLGRVSCDKILGKTLCRFLGEKKENSP